MYFAGGLLPIQFEACSKAAALPQHMAERLRLSGTVIN
jgi:hypothetical protein